MSEIDEKETLGQLQARHVKELRDLQARLTSKRRNATKRTRKGINDECIRLESELREQHEREYAEINNDEDAAAPPKSDKDNDGDIPAAPTTTQEAQDGKADIKIEEKKTNFVSFCDTIATEKKETQVESIGMPKKKRNRHKERLARRAAEMEAMSADAEAEASSQLDRRGAEKTAMERIFAAEGLEEVEIRPDGHCLFAAVADQLQRLGVALDGDKDEKNEKKNKINEENEKGEEKEEREEKGGGYQKVRQAASRYMLRHADSFEPFLAEPLTVYAERIRDTAEWGGQLELLALARYYEVEIRVVQDGRTEVILPVDEANGMERHESEKVVWLAFYRHGYGLGEHYNSLRQNG